MHARLEFRDRPTKFGRRVFSKIVGLRQEWPLKKERGHKRSNGHKRKSPFVSVDPFYESDCQEQTSSRRIAQALSPWQSAPNLSSSARPSGAIEVAVSSASASLPRCCFR